MATNPRRDGPTEIYLEVGDRRVFACALDWPGWCRSGRHEEQAIEALAAYAPRYAAVPGPAGMRFPTSAGGDFAIVERLAGNATTNFGAPGVIPTADHEALRAAAAKRLAVVVNASWAVFDRIAAAAPAELRKGPRGGGRDRDKMIAHVLAAESAYARQLGVRLPQPNIGDVEATAALRKALVAVMGRPSDATAPAGKGWPVRYAARRVAWHVLDHAWEMEDRAQARVDLD
jgi:hypothetical protein